jgi:hypothetical protein
MPIAPVLQRFVDDELTRAPAQIERTISGVQQLLRGSCCRNNKTTLSRTRRKGAAAAWS